MASNKLKRPSLSRSVFGYDIDETNRYISYVIEKYNNLLKENASLKEKYTSSFSGREEKTVNLSHLSAEVLTEMIERENAAHSNEIKALTEALKNAPSIGRHSSPAPEKNPEPTEETKPLSEDTPTEAKEEAPFFAAAPAGGAPKSVPDEGVTFDPVVTYVEQPEAVPETEEIPESETEDEILQEDAPEEELFPAEPAAEPEELPAQTDEEPAESPEDIYEEPEDEPEEVHEIISAAVPETASSEEEAICETDDAEDTPLSPGMSLFEICGGDDEGKAAETDEKPVAVDDFSDEDPELSNALRNLFHIEEAPAPVTDNEPAKSDTETDAPQEERRDNGEGDFYPSWMKVDGENFDPNDFTKKTAYKNHSPYNPGDIRK